jgi:flagellar basal body-associated protein FliL
VPVPIKSIMLIILIIVVSIVIMLIYSLFFVSLSLNNYYFQGGTAEAYHDMLSDLGLNVGYTEQSPIEHT